MSNLMQMYRSVVDNSGKDSPKPSSRGTQRSNTSLTKVKPWVDDDSLELISNPGSGRGPRKLIQPFTPESETKAFKPVQNGLHFTNGALEGGEDLNATDKEGLSLLHRAVRANDIKAVTFLLDNGADIDIKGKDGFTPLHGAVRFERTEIVKLLLEKGADPMIPSNSLLTPLHSAARRGFLDICSLLLKDPRVEPTVSLGSGGVQPFHLACISGNRELCELFLRNGADITSNSRTKYTPLHVASFQGHEEVCHLLIETASKRQLDLREFVSESNTEGYTALHFACEGGHDGVIDLLLRHGADREALTLVWSASPLHIAAKHGHLSSVELLVLYGAVIDIRDGKLRTPLHSAATFNHSRIVEILLESGADPEAKDELEMTPLLMAVTRGAVETAKLLLDRGVDITANDSSLNSALHLAIVYGRPEMVKLLLEMDKDGVLVRMRDKDMKTITHLAAGLDTSKILEIILENKACLKARDVEEKLPLHIAAETGSLDCLLALSKCPTITSLLNERAENGSTALHLAASNKHSETCELLLLKGADVTAKAQDNFTPLLFAVQAGSLETVKVLLHPLLPNTLEETDDGQNTSLHVACRYNRLGVLQFLLDQGADVTARNNRNMTCLDVAIEWEAAEVAKTLLKHQRWEEVMQFSPETGAYPMRKLVEKLPDVAEVVLDKCITYSPLPPSHEDFTIVFNLRHLDPDADCVYDTGFVPATMAKFRREKLLNHVVSQTLLRYKWMMLGKFLTIFNILWFAIFVILFSCFVVMERRRSILFSDTSNTTTIDEINQKSNFEETAPRLILVFLIFQLIKEIIQLLWLRLAYFKDPTNLLDLVMYATVWLFIFPRVFGEEFFSIETQWNGGIIGLFLSYINLTLHFRRFGGLGLYVTMYVEVLWTFLKVISTFLIALIGYSLVFYVLLGHQGNFSSFMLSLGKIHVMMLGELDYSDMLVEHIVENATVPGTNTLYVPLPGLTIGLFFTFILMVSVVLVNLLVGLAVGDIESIQRTANLTKLTNDALLVEGIMKSYPKFILRRVHRSFLEIIPNRNTMFKRIALAGTDLTDRDFMDKLLNYRDVATIPEEEWCAREEKQKEKQEEAMYKLQATVEAQGKILKAMAKRLNITDQDN